MFPGEVCIPFLLSERAEPARGQGYRAHYPVLVRRAFLLLQWMASMKQAIRRRALQKFPAAHISRRIYAPRRSYILTGSASMNS